MSNKQGKILVVDDEAPVREAVADLMDMLNLGVFMAEDGRQGVDIYREHMSDIALILLDLSMPGMDGRETLHELQLLNPTVKVILCSGYSSEVLMPQVGNNITFLQKPYDIAQLIERIQRYLG